MRHDVFGRGKAGHHRQHHVERDDVGPQRLRTARSRACRPRPRRPPRSCRIAAEDLDHAPAHRARILDHQHAEPGHRLHREPPDGARKRDLVELALDDIAAGAGIAPRGGDPPAVARRHQQSPACRGNSRRRASARQRRSRPCRASRHRPGTGRSDAAPPCRAHPRPTPPDRPRSPRTRECFAPASASSANRPRPGSAPWRAAPRRSRRAAPRAPPRPAARDRAPGAARHRHRAPRPPPSDRPAASRAAAAPPGSRRRAAARPRPRQRRLRPRSTTATRARRPRGRCRSKPPSGVSGTAAPSCEDGVARPRPRTTRRTVRRTAATGSAATVPPTSTSNASSVASDTGTIKRDARALPRLGLDLISPPSRAAASRTISRPMPRPASSSPAPRC